MKTTAQRTPAPAANTIEADPLPATLPTDDDALRRDSATAAVRPVAFDPCSVKIEGAKLYRIEEDSKGGLAATLAVYCTVILPDGRKMKVYESVRLPLTAAMTVGQTVGISRNEQPGSATGRPVAPAAGPRSTPSARAAAPGEDGSGGFHVAVIP